MISLLVLLQAGPPTVGDTLWITRTVAMPARHTVRPAEWEPPDPIELVGRPRLAVHGTTVEIQYPVTVWRAGKYRVEIPGPLLLGADGSVDSLPPQSVTLTVASVLPDVPVDSPIAPQPRAELVTRRIVSPLPVLVCWALAVMLLLPLRWWWWRRGKPVPRPTRGGARPEAPVERWTDAGEWRAVAALAAARLRAVVGRGVPGVDAGADTAALLARAAEARPAWPLDELRELLQSLERARFGTQVDEDVLTLFRRAAQIESRLARDLA